MFAKMSLLYNRFHGNTQMIDNLMILILKGKARFLL